MLAAAGRGAAGAETAAATGAIGGAVAAARAEGRALGATAGWGIPIVVAGAAAWLKVAIVSILMGVDADDG